MCLHKKINVLTSCLDLLSISDLIRSEDDQLEFLNEIADTLLNYPTAPTLNDTKQTDKSLLGAYLFVSTAQNSIQLAILKYSDYNKSISVASGCIEASLSLLVD